MGEFKQTMLLRLSAKVSTVSRWSKYNKWCDELCR